MRIYITLLILCYPVLFWSQKSGDSDSLIYHRYQLWTAERSINNAAEAGYYFIGTPYASHTLEQTDEQLVVNLQEFDCVTFVETALALWYPGGNSNWTNFTNNLQQLRYRRGEIAGYTSRLHYFSDWIWDNEQLGLVKDITESCGGELFSCQRLFMSTNASKYPQLAHNSALVDTIRQQEADINQRSFFYIPTYRLAECEKAIQSGDIIAITTKIKGLDISHVGFASRKNGVLYFLHASMINKRVELTALPLTNFILQNRNNSGIMVARPILSVNIN